MSKTYKDGKDAKAKRNHPPKWVKKGKPPKGVKWDEE